MRIAILSTFYPFRGGITHFNHSVFKTLAKDHEVKAFTFSRQYPEFLFPGKTQLVTEEDKIEDVKAQQVLDTVNPFSYGKTYRQIMKFKPEVLIMKYWMPFFAPSLGYVAGRLKKNGIKVITVLDNVIPHEKKFYDIPLTRYFLKRNSAFVAMSETVKKDLLSLVPDASYILQEHPLYDHFGEKINKTKAREKLGIPLDKKVLLFFGFVRHYKGLDILMNTLPLLSQDYYLLVAGEVYGDEENYRKIAGASPAKGRMNLQLRYIADHEVPLFFSAADVNVLPYRSATQSGILAIAFHFDLPVIVTDVGSLRDTVEKDNTGLVVDTAQPDLLEEKIESFFSEYSKNDFYDAIQKFKQRNSWQSLADAIVQLSKNC